MKKLAICIPTYNRCDIVRKWLEQEIDIIKKYDIDVIFYDSSTDNKIISLLDEFINNGNSNIFYKSIDSSIDGNEKTLMIFEEQEILENYEYIWLTHDRTIFYEEMIEYIWKCLDKKADFYIIDMYSTNNDFKWIKDYDEFLIEGAYRLLRYGACIINSKKIIKGTNWKDIRNKYWKPEMISSWHVGFYFERMTQIKDPRIVLVRVPAQSLHLLPVNSEYKRSWYAKSLQVFATCWYNTIKTLPDIYCTKKAAYRTIERENISKYTVLQYKKEGGFSFFDYIKYREALKLLSPSDYPSYFWIAILPVEIARKIIYKELKNKILLAKKESKKILIYGAGVYGRECATFFKDANIKFDGFLVTNLKNNGTELLDYPIYEAKEYLKNNEAYIIISVMSYAKKGIEDYLEKLKESSKSFEYIYFYE